MKLETHKALPGQVPEDTQKAKGEEHRGPLEHMDK